MNRALTIHLSPAGNVADRKCPIGNPKLEFLPANAARIEAELRGMIEKWLKAGRPLDSEVRHPFTDWAQTIGGILQVSGFEDFLTNYGLRRTVDDPLKKALGFLGASRPTEWHSADSWAQRARDLGLVGAVISSADRETDKSRARGMGVVLSAHADETLTVQTDDEVLTLRLEKGRRRFDGGMDPSTRYRFAVVDREAIPEDTTGPVQPYGGPLEHTAGPKE